MMLNDATVIEGLEACFFDDDFVQNDVSRGKESTAGRWTHAEHEMFVKGLEAHSKQWKLIAELIKTRTVVQVRTHAQKYFQKLLKQSKNDGSSINEEALTDMFNDSSSDLLAGLKRKNSNTFPTKNKVKRTESNVSLNMEACSTRTSSESDMGSRIEGDKKRKIKSDRPHSPSPRSIITDSEMEPYLNSYPIQMSNGNSYPQNNIMTEGHATADWFNLGQPHTQSQGLGQAQSQGQRYQQNTSINSSYNNTVSNYSGLDPSQMSYTHGMDCNAHTTMYYQNQSYPSTLSQSGISHSIQQMDFPDPFGIGGGDLNGLDLCWLVDDMDMPDSAAEVYNNSNRIEQFEARQIQGQESHCQQLQLRGSGVQTERSIPTGGSASTVSGTPMTETDGLKTQSYNSETSSAFGSSEAYTSYEESSLTSCTSSDDGCFDEFDASSPQDPSIGDAMAVITNSHKRRLSKNSLALNSMYSTDAAYGMTDTMSLEDKVHTSLPNQSQSQNLVGTINVSLESSGWFRGDDEDLVLGIVEAFSS